MELEKEQNSTNETEVQIEEQPQISKYADYLHSDGRKWDQLTVEEKKKIRKKLAKKFNKVIVAPPTESRKETTYEEELEWCINQLKLGLTKNAVTPEQCNIISNF